MENRDDALLIIHTFFLWTFFAGLYAQKIATLEVVLSSASTELAVPVKTKLNAITFLSDTALSLVKVDGDKRAAVPFQIEDGEQRTLHWLIHPGKDQSGKHVFELLQGEPARNQSNMQARADAGLLTVCAGDRKLLGYQYGTMDPPAGVDAAYQRSGFIHPLWSPRGDVFANFSPTNNMDWLLEPGRRYVLKYRLIVFNGRFTKEKAESGWQNYATSPRVIVKAN